MIQDVFVVSQASFGRTMDEAVFVGSSIEEVYKFILANKDFESYHEYNNWYWEVKKMRIDFDVINSTPEERDSIKHASMGYINRDGYIFIKAPFIEVEEGEKQFRDDSENFINQTLHAKNSNQ